MLKQGVAELGISLTFPQVEKFLIYLEELKKWNKKFNLTSITEDKDIIVKHFIDSLSCLLVMEKRQESLVDIGAGAGFPSIPLKIAVPHIRCTLIEARKKKALFLNHLVKKLSFEDVRIINKRAEEVAHEKERESYDVAVGRAVAPFNVLLEYAIPLLKVGGILIAQKGKNKEDIKKAENALKILGAEIKKVEKITLPILNLPRKLIVVQKTASTPSGYPRRPGIPQKRPL
ncbi:16S rRNA (guanine(527)-N(7))-methyltransferase RsmG [Candidatus Aerophobetes bacterium]|nr:16S rRNA (guanine(527)-N(7))-methyltransferase RsmG [Candidatus Aerophobetes bacterium]